MSDLAPPEMPIDPAALTPTIGGVLGRLARASAIYGIASFTIRAANFLLIPLYTRYLSPADYGIIYLAETVAVFLLLFGNLAMDTATQRLYFQYEKNPAELNSYIGTVVRFAIATMAALLTMAYVIGPPVQRLFGGHLEVPFFPFIAIALATAALSQVVNHRLAIYQAARQPKLFGLFSVGLLALSSVAAVYRVVFQRRGAVGMLSGKLIAAIAVSAIAVWTMRSYMRTPFRWRFVRETLAFSLPVVPHQMMAWGLILADRFILEHYRNVSEVGIYSLAYTLGMVMFMVTQALSQAWVPLFFELAAKDEESHRVLGRICSGLVILLAAIASLGTLLSPAFVRLALDPRYHAADKIVPLIVVGYLFHSLFSLFHISIMQSKRTGYIFAASSVAFAANIVLNLIMIPRWGMYGAAWATTLAYGIEAVIAYFFAQRFFHLVYNPSEIFAAASVCAGALWITQLPPAASSRVWLPIGGTLVSWGLLAAIGRRDLRLAYNRLRRR